MATILTPAPSRHEHTTTRSVVLCDIENLIGDPRADGHAVGRATDRFLDVIGHQSHDLLYAAANPRMAFEFECRRPVAARVRSRCGADGADHALLEMAPLDMIVRSADRLVIGSGDHVFLERAHEARDHGLDVVVVARPGSLHHGYRRAGVTVIPFIVPVDPDDRTFTALAA